MRRRINVIGRRLALTATLTGLVALVLVPASAQAGCGGVRTAAPTRNIGPGYAPLAIGDSTMLLGLGYLAAEGFDANAHGCRQFPEGLAVISQRRRRHRLPHMVLMALGADASISAGQVRQALRLLGPTRVLVLVVPLELGGGTSSDATVVRDAGKRYPGRVYVLDWVRYSAGHGGWFQPDHLHLTMTGAHVFARYLARALFLAAPAVQAVEVPGRAPRLRSLAAR